MSRYYELTIIIKPDIDEAATGALVERVAGFVAAEGGKVLKTTSWGMRRLMYPIRKYREGRYVFSVLDLEAKAVSRLESRLKLMEDVIRFLLIRADDDLDVARLLETESQPVAEAAPTGGQETEVAEPSSAEEAGERVTAAQ
ncbi:MAG: 30S ribosomal protein S6 [Anaerolineae bacterium]|nr:30S ribosomal protein S6 [Thermoflexales bacterium]MDW8406477.1 30S ribosomal protein S6 [Anaerolineae bacterium]